MRSLGCTSGRKRLFNHLNGPRLRLVSRTEGFTCPAKLDFGWFIPADHELCFAFSTPSVHYDGHKSFPACPDPMQDTIMNGDPNSGNV